MDIGLEVEGREIFMDMDIGRFEGEILAWTYHGTFHKLLGFIFSL